jgi:cysteine synthase A
MTSQASRTADGRGRLYDSAVGTIGTTPCIRVNRVAPKQVQLYEKADFFDPAGFIKDRLAISILEEAERRDDLKSGQTVVEATSATIRIGLSCSTPGFRTVAS